MKEIRRSSIYKKWVKNLRDLQARARIFARVKRLAEGNPGDNRFLGDISEMRIDYGPGYRVYYKDTGKEIILLLCGGDKTTQQADIIRAREIALIPIEENEEE
jgi:putative addiction module killer protein